jgi:hypothetical protein
VNAGGNELLSGPALTDNQHRPVQLRHPGNALEHFEEDRGFTDQWLFLSFAHQSSSFAWQVAIVRKMAQ